MKAYIVIMVSQGKGMFKNVTIFILCIAALSGCATQFPSPQSAPYRGAAPANGAEIFKRSFEAHGGAHLASLNNLNVGLTGEWKQLIRRIQPLVTDFTYRVDSQERLFPSDGVYAAQYQGPAGTKSVFRTPDTIEVYYNGIASTDPAVLSSTALTADAFHLFLLGPLALQPWQDKFTRLSDAPLKGIDHYRLHLQREPGFGFSAQDSVVLWIDKETLLTKLVQITLQGHETTQGAHVEVEYLEYHKVDNFIFPVAFYERVNAPISIDAHAWQLTGIDVNRSYSLDALRGPNFTQDALPEANVLPKLR